MKKVRNIIMVMIVVVALAVTGFLVYLNRELDDHGAFMETSYDSIEEMYMDNLIDSVSPDGESMRLSIYISSMLSYEVSIKA